MWPQDRSPGSSAGFTLVEILVVVVILGITAGIVVPYALNTSSMQATAAARTLVSDLQYAQNVAVTTQSDVWVIFRVVHSWYELRNASGRLIHPITKKEYYVCYLGHQVFDKVRILGTTFTNDMLGFDSLGTPYQGGSITLGAGNQTFRVNVAAATGMVTVTELTGS